LSNPLTTVILPETLAATNLADTVASLVSQGVSVFTYPLTTQLVHPRLLTGVFQFELTGPPGIYTVESGDLVTWNVLGTATNRLGSVSFRDTPSSPQKFYRATRHP
jgi:hypothetical protein